MAARQRAGQRPRDAKGWERFRRCVAGRRLARAAGVDTLRSLALQTVVHTFLTGKSDGFMVIGAERAATGAAAGMPTWKAAVPGERGGTATA